MVLISAGVGATPIQSMLQTLAAADKKDVSYLYACNSADQHTFKSETEQLISQRGWQQFTWYLNDQAHFEGQMNLSLVERELPLSSADFYLCGPVAFMEAVVKQLEGLGVTRDRIHYEVFGPHTYL